MTDRTATTLTATQIRTALGAGVDPDDIRAARRPLGELAWDALSHGSRDDETYHTLPGWPECECGACGCTDPATTTDDGGSRACEACADYTVDADGEVLCSRRDGVEYVTESCGAGEQTRTYLRQSPPPMPEPDPEGEWALYWQTVGDDAHVVTRYSTPEDARQAVAATDWPPPGDHTCYLCGYEVRHLADGEWVPVESPE